MRYLIASLIPLALACGSSDRAGSQQAGMMGTSNPASSFHALSAVDIDGNPVSMASFKGKRLLVVNTASKCGYTKQYAQLQELYDTFKDKDFVVIGFPSNDFGGQEPGSEQEIAAFCQKNYGVSFPMMSKVSTKGRDQHPVYQWLTSKEQNGVMDATVKWNFHKFLIDEEGRLVAAYPSGVTPLDEQILAFAQR